MSAKIFMRPNFGCCMKISHTVELFRFLCRRIYTAPYSLEINFFTPSDSVSASLNLFSFNSNSISILLLFDKNILGIKVCPTFWGVEISKVKYYASFEIFFTIWV